MIGQYKEKIICCKCHSISYREIETMLVENRFLDLEHPLSIILVKKFKCSKCNESKNYTIDMVKN